MDLQIAFEWYRDSKGYRHVPQRRPEPRPWKALLPGGQVFEASGVQDPVPERIVRRGGKLVPYRPLETFDTLFREYAKVDSGEKLASFIDLYGPLTGAGLDADQGEDVGKTLVNAKDMRRVLSGVGRPSELAKIIRQGIPAGRLVDLAKLDAMLVLDPLTKKPKILLTVRQLVDALWLQMGQALSGAAAVKPCLQCGEFFAAGPGTGRRYDAKFCSDEHRVIYNSLARTRS